MFGFFALTAISPDLGAVTEGKVAGKSTFDVIDRQPMINQDSNDGKDLEVKGEI
jgi:hypothetical protein